MRRAVLKKPQSTFSMIYDFAKNRFIEAVGLGLIALSSFMTISLLTYDSSDPSWNVAIDGPIRNIMGLEGAIVADILNQTFGSLSFLCAATVGIWGCCFFAGRHLNYFWARVIMLPITMTSLSTAGQFMLIPFRPGFLGKIVSHKMAAFMNITKISGLIQTIAGSTSLVLLVITAVLAGVTWTDMKVGIQVVMRLRRVANLILFKTKAVDLSDNDPKTQGNELQNSTLFMKLTTFKQTFAMLLTNMARPTTQSRKTYVEPRLSSNMDEYTSQFIAKSDSNNDFKDEQSLYIDKRDQHPHHNNDLPDNDHFNFDIERGEEMQPDIQQVTHSTHKVVNAPTQSTQAIKPQLILKKASAKSAVLNLSADNMYQLPPHELLNQMPTTSENLDENDKQLQNNARQLMSVLEEFGVKGQIIKVRPGPVVTLYELVPAAGIKTSRVVGLADDIARSMCALSARIAVIAGQNALGIELPNKNRQMVFLRELITNSYFNDSSIKLALALGKDISGNPVITDLARMPHLLVAGTTGSGKSVAINTMILSLLYCLSPDRCRFIMIDPKMLELSVYDGIPHLLTPVVTDPKKAIHALKWTVREMEDRYRVMSCLGVRNIEGYNARLNEAVQRGEILTRQIQTGFDPDTGQAVYEDQPLNMDALPYIVVVVDEMADLMMVAGKEIEAAVQRLAQMARAAGIHLIMATQRPSVDVITGTIKANFPTRISFQVTSRFDSRTILGEQGAEQLLGRGDMLFMEAGGKIQRVHGPFVSDREVEQIVHFLKQQKQPDYIDTITDDIVDTPLNTFKTESVGDKVDQAHQQRYQQAVELIKREGKASTSFIQRHLRINYNNAARVIEQMEAEGLISAANHVGKREVYIHGK